MNDELLWRIATEYGIELKRSAAFIMLETGMCTQSVAIEDYIVVKNIADTMKSENEQELEKNLPKEKYERLKEIYWKYVSISG